MVIRPAEISDASSILQMLNSMYGELNFGPIFDEAKVLTRLKSKLFITLVAQSSNELKGFCTVKITHDEYGEGGSMGFLYEMYVIPAFRRAGLAHKILTAMENELSELEINNIELYVHSNNAAGASFWEKSGFSEKYRVLRKKLR